MNTWLKRFAWSNQQAGTAVTYVVLEAGNVIAYYSLSAGSVSPSSTTSRVAKGTGKYPIPILLLARLAVDKHFQGNGLGYGMLQDVLIRTITVAEQVGFRALVVDALDLQAKRFYLKAGFEPSPIDDFRLMLLTKDIRKTLGL